MKPQLVVVLAALVLGTMLPTEGRSLSKKLEKRMRDKKEIERLFHSRNRRETRSETDHHSLTNRIVKSVSHEDAIGKFLASDEAKEVIERLKKEYPGQNKKIIAGLKLFLVTTPPEKIIAPGFAEVFYEHMTAFLSEDDTDTSEHEGDEDEEDEDEEDDIYDEDEEDEEGEQDVAIVDSPQWHALMVLTATNAEVNDPDFVEKWMSKRSSYLR